MRRLAAAKANNATARPKPGCVQTQSKAIRACCRSGKARRPAYSAPSLRELQPRRLLALSSQQAFLQPSSPRPFSPAPSSLRPSSPAPSSLRPFSPEPSSLRPSSPEPSLLQPSSPEPSLPRPSSPEPSLPRPSSPAPSSLRPSSPEPSLPRPFSPAPSWPQPSSQLPFRFSLIKLQKEPSLVSKLMRDSYSPSRVCPGGAPQYDEFGRDSCAPLLCRH